jgi:2-dehydro-3-deoxygalactonokinase
MSGFIAGDWGLSRLRLSLCDAAGKVLLEREGPGVSIVNGMFDGVLSALTVDWEPLPVALCGMVGSTLGWKLVPYVEAPCGAEDLERAVVSFPWNGRRVTIAPGVRAKSIFDGPDVMRGEETQIAGALALHPELTGGERLFCLPGTHAKWVELSDGRIQTVTTAISGELFALLARHGTLCAGAGPWEGEANEAFRFGLKRSREVPLLQALFETRARRLTGILEDSRAFLSGLIIGSDTELIQASDRPVILIGDLELNALYAEALALRGIEALSLDGNAASIAGLAQFLR